MGGEGDHVIPGAIARVRTGTGQTHDRPHGESIERTPVQWRIGRDHDHDGAILAVLVPRRCKGLPEGRLPQRLSDRHARDRHEATEIRLHEHADTMATERCGQHARTRADSALESEGLRSRTGANAALLHGPVARGAERSEDLIAPDRVRPHVVHARVVGFAHDRIDRVFAHARLLVHPLLERIRCAPDAQRAGEQNGRLDLAEFAHLGFADELAVTVADVDRGRHGEAIQIARPRNDRRHARADVIATYDRRVADAHAVNVGDCVQGTGREYADLHAEGACTRFGRLSRRQDNQHQSRKWQ